MLREADVPESHGYGHAMAVLSHLQKALESNTLNQNGILIDESRNLAL